MRIETRHGWLLGVVGDVRCSGGVWFAPVCGDVEDPEERTSHHLCEYAEVSSNVHTDGFDLGDADGLWVRAALPSVFGYAPLHVDDGRYFLLDAAFVAVLPEGEGCWVAYPFACTDVRHATGLVFSRRGPDADLRDRIAAAFWGLLVAESSDRLSPFTAPNVGFEINDADVDGVFRTELVVGYSRGAFFAEGAFDPNSDEGEDAS